MFNERKSIRRLVFYWIAIFLFVGSGHLHAIPVPELTTLGVSSGAPIFALLSSLFVSFLYRIRRLISFKKFLILLLLFFSVYWWITFFIQLYRIRL